MYNDTVIGLVVILLFLAGAGVLNYYEKGKRRKLFLERMMASWGKIPQREYSYDELEHISQFFRKREKEGFYVDDITWNDLDLDAVFDTVDHTVSVCGEEYLYTALRMPVTTTEIREERERLMKLFAETKKPEKQCRKHFF